MLVRDFECRSFGHAERLLGGKLSRTVCNNTVLTRKRRGSQQIQLKLHGHTIVEFHQDGFVELWTRGFRTVTAKDRMNRTLPVPWKVCQRGGQWHVRNYWTDTEHPFIEGMTIREVGAEQG